MEEADLESLDPMTPGPYTPQVSLSVTREGAGGAAAILDLVRSLCNSSGRLLAQEMLGGEKARMAFN